MVGGARDIGLLMRCRESMRLADWLTDWHVAVAVALTYIHERYTQAWPTMVGNIQKRILRHHGMNIITATTTTPTTINDYILDAIINSCTFESIIWSYDCVKAIFILAFRYNGNVHELLLLLLYCCGRCSTLAVAVAAVTSTHGYRTDAGHRWWMCVRAR